MKNRDYPFTMYIPQTYYIAGAPSTVLKEYVGMVDSRYIDAPM
jgi:hypothetical protein